MIEETYPADYQNGQDGLFNKAPFDIMAQWVRDEHMLDYPRESFVYLDTETTGLSGGSGTYAFLIGVGRFEGENFHL
ncbi:MAG: ribonuclease H-like domain-containing protein, partial [Anaerolineales bacterium]|nr:ribonuclease H-like domain-containing protein [Anaerolineales bacterium]